MFPWFPVNTFIHPCPDHWLLWLITHCCFPHMTRITSYPSWFLSLPCLVHSRFSENVHSYSLQRLRIFSYHMLSTFRVSVHSISNPPTSTFGAGGTPWSMWDLPRPGIKPVPPALGVQSLNHWIAREVPPPTLWSKNFINKEMGSERLLTLCS